MNKDLYVLSIQEPWAFCILQRGKTIENRTWHPGTKIGKRILIHAPKKFDMEGYELLLSQNINIPTPREYKLGGIVGECLLSSVITKPPTNDTKFWFTGPYGWVLKEPKLVEFYPCRGHLKFWKLKSI